MKKLALMAAASGLSHGLAMTDAERSAGRLMRAPDHGAFTPGLGRMTENERRAGRYMRDGGGHPNGDPLEGKSAAELIDEIKASVAKTSDKAKEIAEKAIAENGKLDAKVKETADEILLKLGEQTTRLDELEQKAARGRDNGDGEKSIGRQFAESDLVKSLNGEEGTSEFKKSMEFKAVISSSTADAAGSAGAAVEPTRVPGIQALPDREFFIQDLIAPGQMDGSTLEYVQEKANNLAAAEVAELATKPMSDFQLEMVSKSAAVIASYMKASRQILEDSSQLASFIDYRLRYALQLRKEQQLLTGDGVGANIHGIVPQASAFALPAGIDGADVDGSEIDTLRVAMLQAVLAGYPASGHVLNPVDWAKIEMAKDGQGRYLIGNPNGRNGPPTLWNLPVVASQFMTQGQFLTGAFRAAAQYFERWQTRVQVSNENEDDFIHNRVTILGEERGALAVYRPAAFVTGAIPFVNV